MAAVSLALTGTIAALMGGSGWSVGDQLMLVGIGAAMAGLLVRYAVIRAVATHEDLTVRNLFLTRTIAWSEIESMRFTHGDPSWPSNAPMAIGAARRHAASRRSSRSTVARRQVTGASPGRNRQANTICGSMTTQSTPQIAE